MAYLYCPGCRCLPCCCDNWTATEDNVLCPRCRSDCDWREDPDRGNYWWCPSCREIIKPPWE